MRGRFRGSRRHPDPAVPSFGHGSNDRVDVVEVVHAPGLVQHDQVRAGTAESLYAFVIRALEAEDGAVRELVFVVARRVDDLVSNVLRAVVEDEHIHDVRDEFLRVLGERADIEDALHGRG